MSFSCEVKEELSTKLDGARHCRIAFLAALFHQNGLILQEGVGIRTENRALADAFVLCLKKTDVQSVDRREDEKGRETILLTDPGEAEVLLLAMRMEEVLKGRKSFQELSIDRFLLQKSCCRKACLRGIFLTSGSVSDPQRSYHLEIVCPTEADADLCVDLLRSLGFDGKTVRRAKRLVVYLKEGGQISDCLGFLGAARSLLKLENARVVRDIAGAVNRKVNCETANLMKTVTSSVRQVGDIEFLKSRIDFDSLPESLRQAASLRLSLPEGSYQELSDASVPHVGKSGIHYRLKRLSEMAEKLRGSG